MSRTSKPDKKPIEQYDHKGKERCNNPPVGLVTPETDSDSRQKDLASMVRKTIRTALLDEGMNIEEDTPQ